MKIVDWDPDNRVPPEEPGLYAGLPNSVYHASDWISRGHIHMLLNGRTPAHVRYKMDNPLPPTVPLIFGSAYHTMMLEPDAFQDSYLFCPDLTPRAGAEWCQEHECDVFCGKRDVVVLDERMRRTAIVDGHRKTLSAMEDAFQESLEVKTAEGEDSIAKVVWNAPGQIELSAFWVDEETGCKCRARADKYAQDFGVLVDLKSASDAAAFEREAPRYGYDVQAHHYLRGFNALGAFAEDFLFIVQEKSPPYLVASYAFERWQLSLLADRHRLAMGRLAECQQAGSWPGYIPVLKPLQIAKWRVQEGLQRI